MKNFEFETLLAFKNSDIKLFILNFMNFTQNELKKDSLSESLFMDNPELYSEEHGISTTFDMESFLLEDEMESAGETCYISKKSSSDSFDSTMEF